MPSSKVWPEPLQTGTDVEIRMMNGTRKIGVISSSQKLDRAWVYKIEGDAFGTYHAYRVRPLDLSDPDDVEVFLNG